MVNVAVLYTGQTRTMTQTLPFIKKNVLCNDNVHVFSVIHEIDQKSKEILNSVMGNHLKSFMPFDINDPCFVNIREHLLSISGLESRWIYFLKQGGSMIEYYQLYLVYLEMVDYERKHNIVYDFVFRLRTDIVISTKIDFNWLNLTDDDLSRRYRTISQHRQIDNPCTINTLIMNTLLNHKRLDYLKTENDFSYCSSPNPHVITSDYIHNGRYVLTFRKNVCYIINRTHFNMIPSLYFLYATMKTENPYWFDAETQFQSICKELNITIYDSATIKEHQSISDYNRDNYMTSNDQLYDTDAYLFFIMRY